MPAAVDVCVERRPARQCRACRRRWPADWEYCANCAVWLPGNECVDRIVRLVPVSGLTERLALPPSAVGFVLAAEARCDTEIPAPADLERGRQVFEAVERLASAHGGAVHALDDGGVAGSWPDGAYQCDLVLRAAAAIVEALTGDRGDGRQPARVSIALGVATGAEGGGVAARLASLARPGRALVSEAVYRRAVDRFDFCGLTPVVPRSDPLPGPVFELEGPKPARSGTHHEGPERVPLLGRTAVIAELDACLARVEGGERLVLHLVGEPGCGKSKLVREWLARPGTRSRVEPWVTLRAHGVPYGAHPLQVWARLVEPLSDDAAEPSEFQSLSVDEVRDRLRGARVLAIVDDLHWVDASSVQRLRDFLSDPGCTTLAVLAYRPSFVPLIVGCGNDRRIMLAGLEVNAMRTMVDTLAGQAALALSPARRAEIVAHARGNPLYAEEAVGHLGAVMATRTGEARALPPALPELLIHRIRWMIERELPELDRKSHEYLGLAPWRFGPTGERERVLRRLEDLEERLASWLDRFDVIEERQDALVDEFLDGLARIDGQLALCSIFLGRQRPHRHRLAQALARLRSRSTPGLPTASRATRPSPSVG